MSEEGYIKVACHECSERISLPVDGVGVAFNCPHCGVDLQMLLKHICEHCGGRLSFVERPDAIGVQIECSHCHQATVLQPSTFPVDSGRAETEPTTAKDYDEEDYEEYDEEYDEEGYDEEDEPEPDVETRRRTGPPKPRPPGRKGLPKPRPPKRAGSQGSEPSPESSRPGRQPAKIGRTLAGTGTKPKEEESSDGPRKRLRPKRKTRSQRSAAQPQPESQPSSGPVSPGIPSRRIAGANRESQDVDPMDPMGDVVSGPAGPGPGQRKVTGTGGAGPQPTFKKASRLDVDDDDDEDGPWYKNKEKKKLAIVAAIFLLVFIPFGFPSVVSIIDASWGNKIDGIVKPWKWFSDGGYRENRSKDIQIDSIKIEQGDKISHVVGDAKNTSSETLQQVELHFHLFDSQSAKLGEAVEYKNEMKPNSTWSFRAACMFTNVVRADLVEVIVR